MLPWSLWQFCGFSVTLVVTWRVVLRFIASITSSILKKKSQLALIYNYRFFFLLIQQSMFPAIVESGSGISESREVSLESASKECLHKTHRVESSQS